MAWSDLYSEAILGSQNQFAEQRQVFATIDRLDLVLAQNCRDDSLLLQNGKLLPDAVARTSAEGYIGERMATGAVLGQEVVRIELLGLGEDARIAMQRIGHDDSLSASGHQFAT